MQLELIREELKKVLKEERYRHSIGVEEVSMDFAYIYGCNAGKATLSGILHDCAKYLSEDELFHICEQYHLPVSPIERQCGYLLHAKVGALFAEIKYGVEDSEVLNAINYHTTGRPAMTLLEKIIFTADFIEPYRKPIPRIDIIRKMAYQNLDMAIYMITENTLNYLNAKKGIIDTLTVDTYNYYKTLVKAEE